MGEIHELFVLALSLVWFAGATPEWWGWSTARDEEGIRMCRSIQIIADKVVCWGLL